MFKVGKPSIRRLFLIYSLGFLLIVTAVLGWAGYSLYQQEKEAVYRRMALRLQLGGELLAEEIYQVSQNLRVLQTAFNLLEKERPKELSRAFSIFTVKTLSPRDIQYNAYFALGPKLSRELFAKPGYIITTHRDPNLYGSPEFYSEKTFISDVFQDPNYQTNMKEVWYHIAKRSQNVEISEAYFDQSYMREWLITAGLGLYQHGEFVGMVGIDLLVDEINRKLANLTKDFEGLEILFYEETQNTILTPSSENSVAFMAEQNQYLPLQFEKTEDQINFLKLLALEPSKIDLHRGPSGVLFLAAQIKIPKTTWRLIAFQRISDVFLAVQKTLLLATLGFVLTFIFLVLGWRYLVQRVLRPLEELKVSLSKTLEAHWKNEFQNSTLELKKPLQYEELNSLKKLVRTLVRVTQRNQNRSFKDMEKAQIQSIHSSKMASLGQMASGIAHEINNPLSIIVGRLSQLEKVIQTQPIDTNKSMELIQATEKTVFRIAKIIRALRNFSREASADPFEKIFAADLVQEALELCEQRMAHARIEVKVPPVAADLALACQSVPISQVLINILNNAFDAIEGIEKKWIQIEVRSSAQDKLQIRISDSGPGISLEVSEKIMDPFFTTKRVGEGVGLGLSISKGIVESHGGRIFLDQSEPHTTFVVELPLFRPSL